MPMISTFQLPEMAFIRQRLFSAGIPDLSETARKALGRISLPPAIRKTETVAVAVGSRKISGIDTVVYETLRFLEKAGFSPFIVPAMGSHGGATPSGQKDVLSGFGITEAAMRVPINADMETKVIATLTSGLKIFFSKPALAADHLVVINRIKPHTKFRAGIESGLCKMLTIGLGKKEGASEFHRFAVGRSFAIIEEACGFLLGRIPLLFGIALLEDGYGRPARVEAVLPEDLVAREKQLLTEACRMMGGIPFDPLDMLIGDYIGKDISGIGMDSNITGRHRDITGNTFTAPHVKRIFVRDLSPGSDGNGNGIGLADVTTNRLVRRLDLKKTFTNALTAISPEKAAIPMHFETDQECLCACAGTTGVEAYDNLRIVRIKSTAALEYLQVSRSLQKELAANEALTLLTPWRALEFDSSGNLPAFPSKPG